MRDNNSNACLYAIFESIGWTAKIWLILGECDIIFKVTNSCLKHGFRSGVVERHLHSLVV